MKSIGLLLLALGGELVALAGDQSAYLKAILSGANVKIVLVVRDERGRPVRDAIVAGYMLMDSCANGAHEFWGQTDEWGEYVIEGKTQGRLGWWVQKENHYDVIEDPFDVNDPGDGDGGSLVKDGCWQPYGQRRIVVLKKFHNPVVGGFRLAPSLVIPKYGEWLGLDLEKFVWCPPSLADVLVRFARSGRWRSGRPYSSSMELCFTNQPFGGAYCLKKDKSRLESVYCADTNNDFAVKMLQYRTERDSCKVICREKFPEDSYLVFRTRTKTDAQGRLISAHYGKLYGEWHYGSTFDVGGVLFNRVSNDANLEESKVARESMQWINTVRKQRKQ